MRWITIKTKLHSTKKIYLKESIFSSKKKHITFKERIKKYKGNKKVEEYDWGKVEGKEIW